MSRRHNARMLTEPPFIAPQRFLKASEALAQVQRIYDQSITHLRDAMRRFVAGDDTLGHVRACYHHRLPIERKAEA